MGKVKFFFRTFESSFSEIRQNKIKEKNAMIRKRKIILEADF